MIDTGAARSGGI